MLRLRRRVRSLLTPPNSDMGGKRTADQTIDQSASKRPRMSILTEVEDDPESLGDVQLQNALGRLE